MNSVSIEVLGGGGGDNGEEVPEYGYFCATIIVDSRKQSHVYSVS